MVRLRDILDGLTNTLLFGERSHIDADFDTCADQGWALEPMGQFGWWAPSGGAFGLSDVTLSTMAPRWHHDGTTMAPINFTIPIA